MGKFDSEKIKIENLIFSHKQMKETYKMLLTNIFTLNMNLIDNNFKFMQIWIFQYENIKIKKMKILYENNEKEHSQMQV